MHMNKCRKYLGRIKKGCRRKFKKYFCCPQLKSLILVLFDTNYKNCDYNCNHIAMPSLCSANMFKKVNI